MTAEEDEVHKLDHHAKDLIKEFGAHLVDDLRIVRWVPGKDFFELSEDSARASPEGIDNSQKLWVFCYTEK